MAQQCEEARPSMHKEQQCQSSASVSPQVDDSAPVSWGLPTAACPLDEEAARFWLTEFPAKHARWKKEGRVLIHCDRSALGNYMRVLPTALLVSVLLELALVLECDKPADSMRKSAELPLSEYFRSPHIDWHRGRLALGDRAAELDLNGIFQWGTRKNADTSNNRLQPGRWSAVRLYTDAAHQTARLLGPGILGDFTPRLAGLLSNWSGVTLVAKQHELRKATPWPGRANPWHGAPGLWPPAQRLPPSLPPRTNAQTAASIPGARAATAARLASTRRFAEPDHSLRAARRQRLPRQPELAFSTRQTRRRHSPLAPRHLSVLALFAGGRPGRVHAERCAVRLDHRDRKVCSRIAEATHALPGRASSPDGVARPGRALQRAERPEVFPRLVLDLAFHRPNDGWRDLQLVLSHRESAA